MRFEAEIWMFEVLRCDVRGAEEHGGRGKPGGRGNGDRGKTRQGDKVTRGRGA
jgi:hypothetical protein